MPYGLNRNSGSPPHSALPAFTRTPDGPDEKPDLRSAAGNRGEPQQAALTQSEVLPGTTGDEPRNTGQHPAVAETEPGDDGALAENRVRADPFPPTRSDAGRT